MVAKESLIHNFFVLIEFKLVFQHLLLEFLFIRPHVHLLFVVIAQGILVLLLELILSVDVRPQPKVMYLIDSSLSIAFLWLVLAH